MPEYQDWALSFWLKSSVPFLWLPSVADELLIVAVSHQSRKPGYWRFRI
jgi:hypothetical protein